MGAARKCVTKQTKGKRAEFIAQSTVIALTAPFITASKGKTEVLKQERKARCASETLEQANKYFLHKCTEYKE